MKDLFVSIDFLTWIAMFYSFVVGVIAGSGLQYWRWSSNAKDIQRRNKRYKVIYSGFYVGENLEKYVDFLMGHFKDE